MAFSVGHISNEAFRFAEGAADQLHNIDIPHFVVAADVVDLPCPAVMDDEVDGAAVILHIEPVAAIQPFTVNRQRFIVQAMGDHHQ